MKKNYMRLIVALLFATNLMAQNVPNYVPTNGLVGWWPFNGNANDESGNGNHGTVNGAMLTNDRFENKNLAYDFSELNSFISFKSFFQFHENKDASISLWVKNKKDQNFQGSILFSTFNTNDLNRFNFYVRTISNIKTTFTIDYKEPKINTHDLNEVNSFSYS